MPVEHIPVGLVVSRRKIDNPWIDHLWVPVAVLTDVPDAPVWSLLSSSSDSQEFYAGAIAIELHSVDTANLRDNLLTGAPLLWVSLRSLGEEQPLDIVGLTADPAEGEAFTESGGDIVHTVPMPAEIAHRVAAFVDGHHIEREFFKRQRDKAEPGGRRRGPVPGRKP